MILSAAWFALGSSIGFGLETGHDGHHHGVTMPAAATNAATTATLQLPPLPEGVEALKFSEFFVSPVGPHGLEFTAKMKDLHDKKVRILGYMVRQEEPGKGVFILADKPIQLHEHEFGLADDLPPYALHVEAPTHKERIVPFTPGPMLLTGTLKLGNRDESDGRVSFAQLVLDAPTTATISAAPAISAEATTVKAGK